MAEGVQAGRAAHPQDPNVQDRGFWIHVFARDWEAAQASIEEWEANPDLPFAERLITAMVAE